MRPPWKTILQIKWQIIYDEQPTQTIVQIQSKDRISYICVYVYVQIKMSTVTGNWHSQKRCNSIQLYVYLYMYVGSIEYTVYSEMN